MKVTVDGSASSDPDGPVTYAWEFGDGSTGTGASISHTYATAGTHVVRLTVTDGSGLTASVTRDVMVVANQAPIAAFNTNVSNLDLAVDATGSSDADGTVDSYAWTFSDGTSGTGKTTSHTYAAAGTYAVKLTVTDDKGATDTVTHDVTVTAPTVFARDAFGRSTTSGWGSADLGGVWTIPTGSSRHSVASGVGKVALIAGAGTTATLASVSATDVETTVSVSMDKAATGGGQYASVIGRSVGSTGSYQAKVRVLSTGGVTLSLVKIVGGTETALSTTTVTGLTFAAGDTLQLRAQVTGISPTTLKAKVWKSTASEPSAWTATTTDSTAGLQTAGTVGLYSYLSGSATDAPVGLSYDEFWAGAPR